MKQPLRQTFCVYNIKNVCSGTSYPCIMERLSTGMFDLVALAVSRPWSVIFCVTLISTERLVYAPKSNQTLYSSKSKRICLNDDLSCHRASAKVQKKISSTSAPWFVCTMYSVVCLMICFAKLLLVDTSWYSIHSCNHSSHGPQWNVNLNAFGYSDVLNFRGARSRATNEHSPLTVKK